MRKILPTLNRRHIRNLSGRALAGMGLMPRAGLCRIEF
jgi:hypothetical protein